MRKIPLFILFLLTACVTINIYFPAAAADKAADEMIKDIQDITPTDPPKPEANLESWQKTTYLWIDRVLNVIVVSAHAQSPEGANLSIDSVEIRRYQSFMKTRFPLLKKFYDEGFIGITQEGFIKIKDSHAVPLKVRNKVTKLVTEENKARVNLYQAIANANGHTEWYEDIKIAFAKRWISNAQIGWWYQTTDNTWNKK